MVDEKINNSEYPNLLIVNVDYKDNQKISNIISENKDIVLTNPDWTTRIKCNSFVHCTPYFYKFFMQVMRKLCRCKLTRFFSRQNQFDQPKAI